MRPSRDTLALIKRFENRIAGKADESVMGSTIEIPGTPIAGGLDLTERAELINNWRRNYNPLRGLTLQAAIQLTEDFDRGRYANLMWAYRNIERRNADLIALIQRRVAAITKLPWSIKVKDTENDLLEKQQQEFLQEKIDKIDNLKKVIEEFVMASFRGVSMAQKHVDDSGDVIHLEILDPWHVVRDGIYGKYRYNPGTNYVEFSGLKPEDDIVPEAWIIRECNRPIDFFALIMYVYAGETDKNWASFLELYGIPGGYCTAPPGITPTNMQMWQAQVQKIINGGTGFLPNGTTVTPYTPWDGMPPFLERANWISERIILVGTSGMLTMISKNTGIGKGPAEEHADVFDDIAKHEALDISDVFNTQYINPLLESRFPNQPKLAYFEIAANEEQDPVELAEIVKAYSDAGYEIDEKWLQENTGLPLHKKQIELPQNDNAFRTKKNGGNKGNNGDDKEEVMNRFQNDTLIKDVQLYQDHLASAINDDLKPVQDRFENILKIEDPVLLRTKLAEFNLQLSALLKDILRDPKSAQVIANILKQGAIEGVRE